MVDFMGPGEVCLVYTVGSKMSLVISGFLTKEKMGLPTYWKSLSIPLQTVYSV